MILGRILYSIKYFEIILLHCYINYYTKYLIWCYGYNFTDFNDQLVIVRTAKIPITNDSYSN